MRDRGSSKNPLIFAAAHLRVDGGIWYNLRSFVWETFVRSDLLRKQWEKFRCEFDFAQGIEFDAVCAALLDLVTK